MFYLDLPDDDQAMMMVAEVKSQRPGLEVATVRPLFEARFVGPGYPYDVSPDGQRFLVSTPLEQTTPTPITVVVNWSTMLKKDTSADWGRRRSALSRGRLHSTWRLPP